MAAPAVAHVGDRFLARSDVGLGEAAPGDHLQTSYRLWLFGHQLERGAAPWRDPYSFQPEATPTINFTIWPFGPLYWPLAAAAGTVIAWNVFVLLSYVLAGLFTCAWLRELELPRGAALAGGLVFAVAPYRTVQTLGHLLGPISVLLPLALFAFERSRRGSGWWLVLAGSALVSIPLSGQVHVALGAIPFFVAYAWVRSRDGRFVGALVAGLAAVAAGLLVQRLAIAHSVSAEGRTLKDVQRYQAGWLDFVSRHRRHGNESFVLLGWLTPILAAGGLTLLVRRRRYALAALLAAGVVVPALLALGTNLPLYAPLWHAFPPLRYPRVPERLMPIACLSLAALASFAVARFPYRLAPLVLIVALAGDLESHLYKAAPADGANEAYAAVWAQPRGRLLELPVYRPDVHYGSVYLYYDMDVRRQRPFGYSTLAPKRVDPVVRRLEPLNCGAWPRGTDALLRRLGVRYVTLHYGIYSANTLVPDTSWFAGRALVRHGFRPLAHGGVITTFVRGRWRGRAPSQEPPRDWIAFCAGWYRSIGEDGGRPMRQPRARFWVYGSGSLPLRVTAPGRMAADIAVDGIVRWTLVAGRALRIRLPLGERRGWHVVEVVVDRMVKTPDQPELHRKGRREGLRLLPLTSPSSGSPSRRTASLR